MKAVILVSVLTCMALAVALTVKDKISEEEERGLLGDFADER